MVLPDVLLVVIPREEVVSCDTTNALKMLRELIRSPAAAQSNREKVEIVFDGFDDRPDELYEISEVRDYVQKLDEDFPFWLYFLDKKGQSLHVILLCFLPPFLKNEAQQRIFPEKIDGLLVKRWFPALNHISEFAGMNRKDNEAITERTYQYIFHGPLHIKGIVQ